MCWYCHWGLPERVADVFDRAERALDYEEYHWGPGHIVFEDFNLGDDSIKFCIEACDDTTQHWNPKAGVVAKPFLEELLAIPEEERDPVPKDDEDNPHYSPELYPPPEGVKMVRR